MRHLALAAALTLAANDSPALELRFNEPGLPRVWASPGGYSPSGYYFAGPRYRWGGHGGGYSGRHYGGGGGGYRGGHHHGGRGGHRR